VAAIQEWVKRNITYRGDIVGVETLQTPVQTVLQKAGDCDDQSILVATLLATINHPSRFIAFAFQPGEFAHVLTETRIGDNWVSVETTEPVGLGWQPDGVVGRFPYYI
jgi:transglutaminase-like putative cysteine protease